MLKMIIVDDEPDMLEGILNHIPFSDLGISICAVCENGLEGLEAVRSLRPDIILCDITMPQMTGFEMLSQVSLIEDYAPQVIMLTGHNDFMHAKDAIKHRVSDYLVKPVLPDELLTSALSAKKKCLENNKKASHSRSGAESLKASFIETLFSENGISADELKEKQAELNMPLEAKSYFCLYFFFRAYESLKIPPAELSEMKSNVISAVKRFFPNCGYSHFNGGSVRFLVLDDNEFSQDEIKQICGSILRELSLANSFICISESVSSLSELSHLAKQTEYCAKFAFCPTESAVLPYTEIADYMKKSLEERSFSAFEKLAQEIKIKDITEWLSGLTELEKALGEFMYYDPSYVKTIIYQLMNSIISNLMPDHNVLVNSDEHNNLWDNIQNATSKTELFDLCRSIANGFKDIAGAAACQRSLLLSEQMKQYVKNNYMNQVTVVALSKNFYLSPNYLRQLFYSVNGITFKNYLKAYRMEKAKEFLITGNYKIYEVALKVGYNDIKSFRNAFIEHFGVSPSGMLNRPTEE